MTFNKKIACINFAIFVLLLFFACAPVKHRPAEYPAPIIRAGILENKKSIRFEPQGNFAVIQKSAKTIYQFTIAGTWEASVEQAKPARVNYRILVQTMLSKENADWKARQLRQSGIPAEVVTIGDALTFGANIISDGRKYQVLIAKDFLAKSEAEAYLKTSANPDEGTIIEKILEPASGTIQLKSPDGRTFSIVEGFRMTGAIISLRNVDVGEGYHFSRVEDRSYRGEMELRIDKSGLLTAINVLPLESYIAGVLGGEMPDSFPRETLKAQAVAARTFFLFNFGGVHREDLFDVCDDVHCQSYVGLSGETAKITQAIAETHGLVLAYDGRLCWTPYSSVCGGHSENAENVWNNESLPYLQGIWDVREKYVNDQSFSLASEENVAKWVNMQPDVFCNVQNQPDASFANYAKKYFRWSQTYSRNELEKIINRKTGENIGTLMDIVPIQRGSSGRIKEIEIKGLAASFRVRKELPIRQALSETALYSACFMVEKAKVADGIPGEFIFRGAGWGHGVGMCQVGAARMALQGFSFDQILEHYYRGAMLKKIY